MEPDDFRGRRVECTGVWGGQMYGPTFEGYFIRWGEKLNSITDNRSVYGAAEVVAIVEGDDGQVYEVPASRVRFLRRQIPAEYDDIVNK